MAGGALFIAIVNCTTVVIKGNTIQKALLDPGVSIVFIIAVVAWASSVMPSILSRILQVLLFFGAGITAVLLNEVGDLTGGAFFCYALILCLQYDFLRSHFVPKMIGILIVFSAVIMVAAQLQAGAIFPSGIPTILFTVLYIYLIWIAFAEEIREYVRETAALRQEIDKSHVFVEFGKNVTGIVHNLKNKVMALDGYIALLAKFDESDTREYLDGQRAVTQQIKELIDNLMFAVQSRQQVVAQAFSLRKLVRGTVDLFNANESFKNSVQVELNLRVSGWIQAVPLEISQILENLVRNSWEAMEATDESLLKIDLEREGERVILRISDRGPGIDFCSSCTRKNCLDCRRFQIGKSRKEDGTGIGLIFVQQALKSAGGTLRISSSPGAGTVLDLSFPATMAGDNEASVEHADRPGDKTAG